MKRALFTTALLALLLMCGGVVKGQSYSYPPYDFSSVNADGDTLYYRITSSETPYTVAVTRCHDSIYHTLPHPQYAWEEGQPGFVYPVYDYDSLINIPSNVTHNDVNYTVTSVDKEAFYEQKGMHTVVLPSTVAIIDTAAFYLSSVEYVEMPNVTHILYGAFTGAPLSSVDIPECIVEIGAYAFDGSLVRHLSLPAGIDTLREHAFYNCPLETIVFHDGIKVVEDYAITARFIDTLVFPGSLEKLGRISINTYAAPANVDNHQCKQIVIEESNYPLEIGDECFMYLNNLKTIHLPSRTTALGRNCFAYSGMETIALPQQIRVIPVACFIGCDSLREVVLPENLDTIERNAFYDDTLLKTITIPANVKMIKNDAFRTSGVDSVRMECVEPPLFDIKPFTSSHTIHFTVPCHTMETYQSAPGWSTYSNFTYHEDCVGVEDYVVEEFLISPVPFKDCLTVTSSGQKPTELVLYDMFGRLCLRCVCEDQSIQISTSELSSGIYVIQAMDKEGVRYTKKIVKY